MGANSGDLSKTNINSDSYQFVHSIKEKKQKHQNVAVSFNYNSSILLVNQVLGFRIFSIKSQNLKQLVQIKNPNYNSTIQCFKKSNNFVTGNFMKQIITQSLIAINNNKIISKSIIPIQVNCLILNNAENQIIAGGYQKIVILNIQNGLSVHQEFQIHDNWITNLSISEFDTYLAIDLDENCILIMEQCVKDTQKIWIQK
ncbi:unnamed protein product (macronuclear) [Paramecium tetraurelia]|uniref:Anaphase-promoting complex subunit 4 WD40 domain-containing protein n=1 Tax=Paramecium tetraurelia TaxID=5888 RepID=A0DL40_PARTE|nr:uncharacterized protein GSPATT00018074001 [Paramecium tetraurelia]CAK83757.1 unnamed protein product [Paramecium tetraurelia]|eukprot:XP_001451154.1 hypothetical protein (macronuclear) [Paramecium tetraurelia strain d4-2]